MDSLTPGAMLSEIKVFTGKSEVSLAKDLKVSQPTVNRLLNGQDGCSSSTLMSIIRMYDEMKDGKLAPAPTEPAPTEQTAAA